MKKFRTFFLAGVLCASLVVTAGCGETTSASLITEASSEAPVSVSSEEPTETSTDAGTSVTPVSDDWTIPEYTDSDGSLSDEEKLAAEIKILEKGKFLFSGEENTGFYPGDWSDWLKGADKTAALAIIYSCEDESHAGWGVLGLALTGTNGRVQEDIAAYANEPEKERLIVYTVEDLMELAGITDSSDFKGFELGAWNGGKLSGVYFLDTDVADELNRFLEECDEMSAIIHTYDGSLSNENAIDSAVKVYDYIKSASNSVCLTGQMESTWMGSPDYEMNYIEDNSGRLPAIRGLDFMNNDFSGVVSRAEAWWEKGGIVTICWHTGADFASGYNESKSDNIDWDEAFTPGTDTYNALIEGMDRAVPYLKELCEAGVPVLWRPFHEFDGGWFWWGKGGGDNFKRLWQMMYSRYTDYWGLDNLIWVLGYSGNGLGMSDWYPGDDYVDLIGADSYTDGANDSLYEKVLEVAPDGMPIVFHECGTIPTESELKADDTGWTFFMTWHTNYITDENTKASINEIYNSDYFITLDELPSFK